MTILWLAGSFKTMNRPDRNSIWRQISRKVLMKETLNHDKIFIQVFNLCYQNLGYMSSIVSKLYSFRQRSN